MNNDLLYQIALTLVPNIGDIHAKALIQIFGSAAAVFRAPMKRLELVDGIGSVRAGCIKTFTNFSACEAEITFIEKYKITPLFISDEHYPKRLLHAYDSPILLYYRGNADLNKKNIVSIVGTRNHSEYGKQQCEKLVEALKEEDILVVSGLAFGLDTIAHKAAIKSNIPTVGVVAHGLDRIYPAQNKMLAKQMIANGGLLTDFTSGTIPDKQNFPKRNRIVAGICDALVVVESGLKGGSMITAELANSYNKDVFAFPGRATDAKSEGCNFLIKNNKAALISGASDLLDLMNWIPKEQIKQKKQRELFIELSPEEKKVADIIQQQECIQIDELYLKSGLSSSTVAAALLQLEMNGVIDSIPGKRYKLTT